MKKLFVLLILSVLLLSSCTASDGGETSGMPDTTASYKEEVCIRHYPFRSFSDFYLYAEQYETDVEKYEYLKDPPAGYGVPPYQLAVPLIKLEDIIPEFESSGLQLDVISVHDPKVYRYTLYHEDFDPKGRSLRIGIAIRDRNISEGIKIQTASSEYLISLSGDDEIFSITVKLMDDLYCSIILPTDPIKRRELEATCDIPLVDAMISGNLIDIEKATATVKQNVIEKLAERYSES